MTEPARLGILALDGCMMSSVAHALDAIGIANTVAGLRAPSDGPRFEAVLFSARGADRVRTSTGFELACDPRIPDRLDRVLVPGLMHRSADDLDERTAVMDAEIEALRTFHSRGVPLAAGCSGTWLLARTGALDGRNTTASWWLGAAFKRRFPQVRLDHEAILVKDGAVTTGGAASAIIDIVLDFIGQFGGPELAETVGRLLLVDTHRQSQAPFIDLALIERPRHSLSERAERFLRDNLHRDVGVAELAAHCDVSERTLLRHFRAQYGCTPHEYLQQMRVDRAKALLESTLLSFEEIVAKVGYSDTSSFRKLFKRRTSRTPADYRECYRLRA